MNEEVKKKISEIRAKYKDNSDIDFLITELGILELRLRDADVMALTIDVYTKRKLLDERSLINDARLEYGNPFKYEFARKDILLGYGGGIPEVIEILSKKD